ncbi:MAG TPA: CheR family methyltransferase [Pyrinomonadaceae bacterium]|nr:CheR family methyltransferase [Pyrinomonadaceae bacterium]
MDGKLEVSKDDLVVVGASAGGVGALSTLVSTLNKSFPAPIVIAQHLDPQRPSHLGSILERRSTLPIMVVSEHGQTRLEGGKVYVVPSNSHVRISDGHVYLEGDHNDRPKPSVDMLLSSAARSYGEHLIAVILTGSGSDGAAGAVDVKTAGGVVIIQNPQTAAYPSMPLSLPPRAVDHVLEIEQIGPLLYDLLKGVSLPAPTEKQDDPFRDLLAQVSAQTSIDFRNYKSSTILRRIGRRMAVTHNGNLRDYADYLRGHPDEVAELVKAFLIKVTGFFRDPEAFEFLNSTIIPELIDRARANGRTLRLWSAGCATGEEAYSLALLVADHLGSDFPEWNVKIFATDLAADAIAFARRGLYPENVLNDLPNDFRMRYFERIDHGYRVSKTLRQVVIFGQQDISRGVPFPRIDLVTCRNLLIYLNPELQQVVLDLFAYSLHQSHGYMFLGKAETARPTKAMFELVNKKWKIYRCVGGSMAFPLHEGSLQQSASNNLWRDQRRRLIVPVIAGALDLTHSEVEIAQLRRVNETMLRYTNVAVVIIDRQYRILTINANARRLLAVRDVAYDQDFLHTVRGMPYQEMRRAIDTCFREHTTMNLQEIELDQFSEGSGRYVSFTVMLMQVEQGAPELAVITAMDATDQVQIKKRLEAVQREHADLVTELSAANKRFGTMNKELQDANEELQAANEELMLTQEELQATNEEFEATNEELQATNEELETNNEELQATNEELQTTNDELTARTAELQELSKQHRLEQLQLASVLERYPYYIMVLHADDLTIQSINPNYRQFLGGRDVKGLSMSEVFNGKQVDHLLKALKTAARESQTLNTGPILASVDGDNPDSVRFVHTVVPISDASGSSVTRLFLYSEKAD